MLMARPATPDRSLTGPPTPVRPLTPKDRPVALVACPGCPGRFRVPSGLVGRVRVRCRRCGAQLAVVWIIRESGCETCGAPVAGEATGHAGAYCSDRCRNTGKCRRYRLRERERRAG